jgi:hypothetical protein
MLWPAEQFSFAALECCFSVYKSVLVTETLTLAKAAFIKTVYAAFADTKEGRDGWECFYTRPTGIFRNGQTTTGNRMLPGNYACR